jgi:hypothetical protein
MHASIGDIIEVDRNEVGTPPRHGKILAVRARKATSIMRWNGTRPHLDLLPGQHRPCRPRRPHHQMSGTDG